MADKKADEKADDKKAATAEEEANTETPVSQSPAAAHEGGGAWPPELLKKHTQPTKVAPRREEPVEGE